MLTVFTKPDATYLQRFNGLSIYRRDVQEVTALVTFLKSVDQ